MYACKYIWARISCQVILIFKRGVNKALNLFVVPFLWCPRSLICMDRLAFGESVAPKDLKLSDEVKALNV